MAVALGGDWAARDRYTDAVDGIEQALNLPADADPYVCLLCVKGTARLGRGAEQPRSWLLRSPAATPSRALSRALRMRAVRIRG